MYSVLSHPGLIPRRLRLLLLLLLLMLVMLQLLLLLLPLLLLLRVATDCDQHGLPIVAEHVQPLFVRVAGELCQECYAAQ